jgi:hypothetical protein
MRQKKSTIEVQIMTTKQVKRTGTHGIHLTRGEIMPYVTDTQDIQSSFTIGNTNVHISAKYCSEASEAEVEAILKRISERALVAYQTAANLEVESIFLYI